MVWARRVCRSCCCSFLNTHPPRAARPCCGRRVQCHQFEEALAARAVELQAAQLKPPPASALPFRGPSALSGGGGSGSGGSPRPEDFRLRAFYDLPLDLSSKPEWETWMRRLRGELIAWQQQQQRQQQQQEGQKGQGPGPEQAAAPPQAGPDGGAGSELSASGEAAVGTSPAGTEAAAAGSARGGRRGGVAAATAGAETEAAAEGAAQRGKRGVVSATYSMVGVSPDGLGMRTELVIRVQLPERRRLVRAVSAGAGLDRLARAAPLCLTPCLPVAARRRQRNAVLRERLQPKPARLGNVR